MREDLLSTVAPEARAENTADLFRILRNSSLQRDTKAPIAVSREEIDHWKNKREDLRAQLESNGCKKSIEVRILVKKHI